ncbi:hypothetical protein ACSS6W_009478 [Trichoderma asperelloides]
MTTLSSTSTTTTTTTTMTTMTLSSPSKPKVGFMSLPLELRFQIYSLLLTIPPRPHAESTSHDMAACNSEAPVYVYPAILLANRQINWEATPFLYSENMFVAHPTLLASFPRLRSWYPPMREANALVPLIHRFHVQVPLDVELPYDRAAVAKSFTGVDELSLDLRQSVFLSVSCNNLTLFDAVRGVNKVYISGSTTGFEDYIAWLKDAMTSPIGAEVAPFEAHTQSPWAGIWSKHSNLWSPSTALVGTQEA